MKRSNHKNREIFYILFVIFSFLLVFKVVWAQPSIISVTPADKSYDNPINTKIKIQFSTSMNPASGWVLVEDEYDAPVEGDFIWSQTTVPNDTLTFIPNQALKPGTHYEIEGSFSTADGHDIIGFEFYFITKPSSADATPPRIQTTFPYNGMTNFPVGETIHIKFSEAMNPPSITTPGNIILTGPGIVSESDYTIRYDFEEGSAEIKKNSPFIPNSTYHVTITTKVKDLRGNWLRDPYQFSFTTGPADTTPPTVVQTLPTPNDQKVHIRPIFHVIFSEEMDESTFISSNITLRDNTSSTYIPVHIRWGEANYLTFEILQNLTHGHNYTVTIGTGVRDKAGNSLTSPYQWSFTVAGTGVDSDPVIDYGVVGGGEDQVGFRWSDGTTRVELRVSAWDDFTNPLNITVSDLTQPGKIWTLTKSSVGNEYEYISLTNEGLTLGMHNITFTIKDGATPQNQISFLGSIFIFDTSPSLISPTNGQTGVSNTPTFQWQYNGTLRPFIYTIRVMDGPNPDTAKVVWKDYIMDQGAITYSLPLPKDKALLPQKTYYWMVTCTNYLENGKAHSEIRSFTTGGSLYPPPSFSWYHVRSNDYPTGMQYNIGARIIGPSPKDIAEFSVTGPGGFKYIFTEDDLFQSEFSGLFYWKSFSTPLPNGTYIFKVIDSLGRTTSANYAFTFTSVPRVSTSTMSPTNNSYLNTTTPTFNWGAVTNCPGCVYRITILDWNSQEANIYVSEFTTNTYFTLPSGYLLPNTAYKWRVEVYDSTTQNRSISETLGFSTGSQSYTLDLKGSVMTENIYYYLGERKNIIAFVSNPSLNAGPLPDDIVSLTIGGPNFHHSFTQSEIFWNSKFGNMFVYSEPGLPENGTWVFNILDRFGNSDDYSKEQTSGIIPIVDYQTMSPSNNAYLRTLTPTFSWGAVSGGPWYYRISIWDWKSKYVVYNSTRSTALSATVPKGILKWNHSYKWRVEVFDNPDFLEANKCSRSIWYSFTTSPLKPGDSNGDGQTTIDEVQKCINQFLGLSPVEDCNDLNGDGVVTIDEVQRVINAFLE